MSDVSVSAYKALFDSEATRNYFKIIWDGFRAAYAEHSKGFAALRLCKRILDKLEEISDEVPLDNDPTNRVVKVDAVQYFTKHEYERLVGMLKSDIPWIFSSGRTVEAAILWVDDWKIEARDDKS